MGCLWNNKNLGSGRQSSFWVYRYKSPPFSFIIAKATLFYILGGISTTQIYENGAWSWGPNMPFSAINPGIASVGPDEFVIFGGYSWGYVSKTYKYDFIGDTWTQLDDRTPSR